MDDIHSGNDNEYEKEFAAGRNAVSEALNAGAEINTVFVAEGAAGGTMSKIISQAKERGIPVKTVDARKLDRMCPGANNQGVIASLANGRWSEVSDIFDLAEKRSEPPFIVICDEIEDPHNLGAVIRSAEAAGAHGVIVPKRRSAALSFAVSKTSAGAVEYIPVARVTNLSSCIEDLKKKGLWIYGADMNGQDYKKTDLKGPIALVIGSEGSGISRLVSEKCDMMVSIPMKGSVNSLNASVAAGILMFEISYQRSSSEVL